MNKEIKTSLFSKTLVMWCKILEKEKTHTCVLRSDETCTGERGNKFILNKVKSFPHKIIFAIGLTLNLAGVTLANILPFGIWSILFEGILLFVGTILIVNASDKKHSNKSL
ncbi:hypothetical protein J1P26_22255 [Neobacillus sp. MM2021_6]|uniref:hypothetical protein n=1 Tax=Bacillaceae TaxID=186817 RepID=UPI00140763E1|nr:MULTISPECIES: hypothetical protein [Bacillaceae]MBO0962428.1 hypothetical protein [Neobacillus sp. MM2021_6]NHC21115.1 hypothetical protein [Bacillus sp. MM2020_4]